MKAHGGGWILNISSATSNQPAVPYRDSKQAALVIGPYGATKAALDRYTEALAHELAEHEIFVNAMAPVAIVLTQGADYVRDIARRNPDMVEPVEMMAEAALELCTGHHVGRVVFSRDPRRRLPPGRRGGDRMRCCSSAPSSSTTRSTAECRGR